MSLSIHLWGSQMWAFSLLCEWPCQTDLTAWESVCMQLSLSWRRAAVWNKGWGMTVVCNPKASPSTRHLDGDAIYVWFEVFHNAHYMHSEQGAFWRWLVQSALAPIHRHRPWACHCSVARLHAPWTSLKLFARSVLQPTCMSEALGQG